MTPQESRLKRRYGITLAQWHEMFRLQKGRCPVCRRTVHEVGNAEGKRAAAVDHDHKTGRVRGLTCYRCNRFKIARNTVESAKRLYDYLASEFDGRNL